jgi:hypothetical protein
MDLDLLYFDSHYRVVVCRRYQCAVVPREVTAHLRTLHKATDDLTDAEIRRCAKSFLTWPFDILEVTRRRQFPPDTLPIPFLALHLDGWCCRLCPTMRPYICRTQRGLTKHLKAAHQWSRRRGRQSIAHQLSNDFAQVALFPVAC